MAYLTCTKETSYMSTSSLLKLFYLPLTCQVQCYFHISSSNSQVLLQKKPTLKSTNDHNQTQKTWKYRIHHFLFVKWYLILWFPDKYKSRAQRWRTLFATGLHFYENLINKFKKIFDNAIAFITYQVLTLFAD